MSLQLAAQHLAAQGRGPDKQLVHMSPREVAGLQALAMAHGGSLTTNPDTGLPEAGALDNLLPMIIGAGLMFATGGASAAAMPGLFGMGMPATIGLGIGALETARTGNLQKGIMAGLGAYGGAGLTAGLAGSAAAGPGMAVTNPAAPQIAMDQAAQAGAQAGVTGAGAAAPSKFGFPELYPAEGLQGASTVSLDPNAPYEFVGPRTNTGFANLRVPAPAEFGLSPSVTDLTPVDMPRTAGFRAVPFEPSSVGPTTPTTSTFAERFKAMPGKDLAKYGLAAAAPVLLAPPEYDQPELDREQYRYAYSPGPVMPPTRMGDVGEYTYFRPQYTRLAMGGPVEAMSAANVYDMQNARGGVSDMGIDNSTGMQKFARGGISDLGDYSDGGRLLKGPGDGVSDSIPAMIGRKQPARLADGEFVIPARIVSELGNGSTDAGARKLYAMMDRIQKARGKTVGKGKVAKNSKAEKYLPA